MLVQSVPAQLTSLSGVGSCADLAVGAGHIPDNDTGGMPGRISLHNNV